MLKTIKIIQMKKYILFITLYFTLLTICNAQVSVYHPFPDSNAIWGMSSGCTDVNCGDYAYIKNYYGGDTIIDGINYKKVIREILLLTNGNCCILPEGLSPGFLRQDTVSKKVYWRNQWMNSDTLLYDFTLNVGDTLNGFLQEPYTSPPLTVVSIDSILVGESYRKRINIDTNTTEPQLNYSIIEGLGSTDGFVAPHVNYMGSGIILSCFSEKGLVLYTHSINPDTIPCGTLPVAIEELLLKTKESVTIFPNPSNGRITLKCQPFALPFKIAIYDMVGRKHLEKEINNEYSEVDISLFTNGIYLLRTENNKALITFIKIVKQ
jgi:hypothetical protein